MAWLVNILKTNGFLVLFFQINRRENVSLTPSRIWSDNGRIPSFQRLFDAVRNAFFCFTKKRLRFNGVNNGELLVYINAEREKSKVSELKLSFSLSSHRCLRNPSFLGIRIAHQSHTNELDLRQSSIRRCAVLWICFLFRDRFWSLNCRMSFGSIMLGFVAGIVVLWNELGFENLEFWC